MSVHEYQKPTVQCKGITLALVEAGFSVRHTVFDELTGLPTGTIRIEFFDDLTAEQETALDDFMATYDGEVYHARLGRLQSVDRVTQVVLSRGFTHAGKAFSLSLPAQANWNRMAAQHAAGKLSFPTDKVSLANGQRHTFADANEYEAFEDACTTAVEAALEAGRTLRDQLYAASTVEELDAVVDDREFQS